MLQGLHLSLSIHPQAVLPYLSSSFYGTPSAQNAGIETNNLFCKTGAYSRHLQKVCNKSGIFRQKKMSKNTRKDEQPIDTESVLSALLASYRRVH